MFSVSLNQLKLAQQKFKICQSSLDDIQASSRKASEGSENSILIPLTSSVYVPGKLSTPTDKVLIDIGTGYFVEKVDCTDIP